MTEAYTPVLPDDQSRIAASAPDAKPSGRSELPLGAALQQLRGERNRRDVQRDSGISDNYLCKLELGVNRPGLRILERLTDYYGVSMSELFRRAEVIQAHGEAYQRAQDANIERSYRFVLDDPHLERYGQLSMALPLEAKQFVIRVYEHYTGLKLLPDET